MKASVVARDRDGSDLEVRIVIVGAGMSGVAAAVKLQHAGFADFVLLERGSSVGGTWRDNTYPGCAVDVPSPVYSFSFNPNPDWNRHFAHQPEVLGHISDTVERFGLSSRLRLGVEVIEATWLDEPQRWRVRTTDGTYIAQHVIFATGPMSEPKMPEIPGLESFPGAVFHSARWDHDFDLTGKRVAVIGTGCSAAQIVPAIHPLVERLHVFQRTPAWVVPRLDFRFPRPMRWLFRRFPGSLRLLRRVTETGVEVMATLMRTERRARLLSPVGRLMLRVQVRDRALRQKVTPRYTIGCKRLVFSNTFLPALCRSNVELVPEALVRVEGDTVVSAAGDVRDVDAIVFASGFEMRSPPIADRVVGRGGVSLAERWRVTAEAYLATTVPGMPNAYFLLGPNIVGYRSLVAVAEDQVDYIVAAIRTAETAGIEALEVRADVCDAYNREVQQALGPSVYNRGGCSNVYVDRGGHNFVNWPWSTSVQRRRLGSFAIENYTPSPSSAGSRS